MTPPHSSCCCLEPPFLRPRADPATKSMEYKTKATTQANPVRGVRDPPILNSRLQNSWKSDITKLCHALGNVGIRPPPSYGPVEWCPLSMRPGWRHAPASRARLTASKHVGNSEGKKGGGKTRRTNKTEREEWQLHTSSAVAEISQTQQGLLTAICRGYELGGSWGVVAGIPGAGVDRLGIWSLGLQ